MNLPWRQPVRSCNFKMLNALTIDVEDYFMVSAFADIVKFEDWPRYESRVEKNTLRILDLLDEHNVKATFFVLGWVAEHYPKLALEIHNRGHEVACHGYSHRLVYDLSLKEFQEDTKKSKALIEDTIGVGIGGYRAASYSILQQSLWALDILIEEGFIYDSSIFPIYHDRYGYHGFNRFPVNIIRGDRGKITEVPLSTIRLFGKNIPIAGGGYLRLFPVKFVRWAIRSLNEKEAQPAVIYFHPWEIDPEQPRLNGSRRSTFRHYINMDKTFAKISHLLDTFRFGPIKEVVTEKLTESILLR